MRTVAQGPEGLAHSITTGHKRRMHLTALFVLTLSNQLHAVSGWLNKAELFASGRGESPDGFLSLRLAPDMFPLTTQLRFLAFQAQEPVYRLRGRDVPENVLRVRQEGRDGGERPGTWSEARVRMTEAADLLAERSALLPTDGPRRSIAG